MISIIVPVYNVEDYLYVCLNSILRQSYQDFEVICIDDSSSDSSLEILEYFAFKDSRIKIIKNDSNKGKGFCRNLGLNVAKGDYISFLNANDWLSSDALEVIVKNMHDENLEVLIFENIIFDDNECDFLIDSINNLDFLSNIKNKVFNHFDLEKFRFFEISTNVWNKVYSKSFLDRNGIRFNDENLFNIDIPFVFNVLVKAKKISYIDSFIYNYRKISDSLINLDNEQLFDLFQIYNLVLHVFLKDFSLFLYYQHELLNHVFVDVFYEIYCHISDKFKERFVKEVQTIFKNLILNYNLYDEILKQLNPDILSIFRFEEIIKVLNNPPKISIIVPAYNTENELPIVLDSIVNQTFGIENLEVIVINDCSTDHSQEIIDKYSEKYGNFVTIHLTENSGSPSKPRNLGIKYSTAEYIMFQDSDYEFTSDACELLYDAIISEKTDIVGGMIRRNDTGNYRIDYNMWCSILSQSDKIEKNEIKELLTSDVLYKVKFDSINDNLFVLKDFTLNAKIYKKSLFLDNNIEFKEDLNGGEDSLFLFNCLINAKGIIFINKVIYNYNALRSDSLTHNFSLKTIQSRPKAYKLMYDLAVLNDKKDVFVREILSGKLSYWFNSYLIKAPNLTRENILSIFKKQQIIFTECINYNLKFSNFLLDVFNNIKLNNFDIAIDKVMKKRKENFKE